MSVKRKKTGGRKQKYTSPTITKAYRIPKDSVDQVDKAVKDIIAAHIISTPTT